MYEEVMEAYGATMILVDQKSGHKNSCIHHEKNGEPYLNPVIELWRQYVHLRKNRSNMDCLC